MFMADTFFDCTPRKAGGLSLSKKQDQTHSHSVEFGVGQLLYEFK